MQYIFRTSAKRFAPIFRKKINENVTEKFCLKLKSEPNFAEKLCVENTLRETKFDKPSCREILKPKTKLCG